MSVASVCQKFTGDQISLVLPNSEKTHIKMDLEVLDILTVGWPTWMIIMQMLHSFHTVFSVHSLDL